jgi:glycosyltransferase involved in cell wall biosynthesis
MAETAGLSVHHIALVTTSYPDGTPGSEAAGGFVEDFARELSTRVRVTVIAAGYSDSAETSGDLTVCRFAVPRLPLSLLSPGNPSHWWAIIRTLHRGLESLRLLVARDRPNHILALWALPCGYWARVVSGRHQIPYSTWALGSDIWSLGRIPVVRTQLRRVLEGAHGCYADGYGLTDEIRGLSGRDCVFLPSTRRMEPPSPKSCSVTPPWRLAFLGRWHANKGVDMLLEALLLLSGQDWERISEVRIFGGGPLQDFVAGRVSALRDNGRPVSMGGYLDKIGAAELIDWADYLMLPSRIESIPVIFSDAAKIGTPLVATPVGDLPRLHAEYQFGVIASAVTPAAIVMAIRSALEKSPAEFYSGLERAREDFSLPATVSRFLETTTGSTRAVAGHSPS